jgi:hypothetical protein
VVSLVNGPRAKVDLIEFRGKRTGTVDEPDKEDRYFFLRKMVFKAPGNVEGFEIKLSLEAAALLRVSLKRELEDPAEAKRDVHEEEGVRARGPEAVRSA